ncbi:hypothetical protein SAMN06295945_1727 [Polynucleobacter meluiroseus]|uniref:Uncharacterized protein n=1 Tax=Polynucleobacter meluiroseus TaxID=1938814 RepID=A0A240E4B3_9BURK|nr:hypothetical protein [Polynucleobacter meluiroseus]SNX29356.1 hypothetical protein SAMN06295945_1727 [Polynucleobacter meluiroseus]
MEEQKYNKDGVNLKIQRTDMHQFTGMARVQMFAETVMSVLRMILAVVLFGGVLVAVGVMGWVAYTDYQQNQAKAVKAQTKK